MASPPCASTAARIAAMSSSLVAAPDFFDFLLSTVSIMNPALDAAERKGKENRKVAERRNSPSLRKWVFSPIYTLVELPYKVCGHVSRREAPVLGFQSE